MAEETESIEDILRHDKGHDDWHASHGDPPCKSEADCARMQAKYDAEQSAVKKLRYMISQGGHVGAVALEILAKYSPDQERDDHGRFGGGGGGGASHAQERAASATQAANAHGEPSTENNTTGAKLHADAAEAHREAMKESLANGKSGEASFHLTMAQEHAKKAEGYEDAAHENEDSRTATETSSEAGRAYHAAANAEFDMQDARAARHG